MWFSSSVSEDRRCENQRVLVCVTAMLVPLVAIAQTAPPASAFPATRRLRLQVTTMERRRQLPRPFARPEEVIFRLYFVDTPEEERVYADRIAEQAAYFGISADAALEVGKEASEFTKRTLAKPFTTYTRWRRALGRSAIWRYYAIVVTADGRDLNGATCERGTCANLRDANAVAGWSRFADIPGASA